MSLEDAATIDGCTTFQSFFKIVLPLASPGIITAGFFTFTQSWTMYLYPLVFISSSARTVLPVGIGEELLLGDVYLWGPLMASAIMTALPVVILFIPLQRYVIQGLTAGGVKG